MLLAAELRKLLNPRLLVIAGVLSAAYALVFLAPLFRQLVTDHPTLELHQVSVLAAQQFGEEISSREYRQWRAQYQRLEREADARIAADAAMRELEIFTWDEFSEVYGGEGRRSEQATARASQLLFDAAPGRPGLGFALQSFRGLLDGYALIEREGVGALPQDSDAERSRVLESGSWRAIQDQTLVLVIPDFARSLAVLVILVVLLLTAPVTLTDSVRRMRALQYSSRSGRAVFAAQFGAIVITSAAGGVIACIGAAVALAANQAGPFLPNSLWSFQAFPLYRSNLTLLAAIVGDAALVMLLAVAAGCAAFLLARWSRHHTGLLVRLVVAFAVLVACSTSLLAGPFTTSNPVWEAIPLPGVEIASTALLATLLAVASFFTVRREHRTDLRE